MAKGPPIGPLTDWVMEQRSDRSHDRKPAERVDVGDGAGLGVSPPAIIIALFTTVTTVNTHARSSMSLPAPTTVRKIPRTIADPPPTRTPTRIPTPAPENESRTDVSGCGAAQIGDHQISTG